MSMIFKTLAQHIPGLAVYDMMRSSHDFEDVRVALADRIDWSIELFRSCLTIAPLSGNHCFVIYTMVFLVMTENIRIHYGRLSAAELKEHVGRIGYAAFATLFAVLDIAVVGVRVMGFVALSESPALAASLVLVSVSPLVILPMLIYPARFLRRRNREPTSDGGEEMESGTVVGRTEAP